MPPNSGLLSGVVSLQLGAPNHPGAPTSAPVAGVQWSLPCRRSESTPPQPPTGDAATSATDRHLSGSS